LCGYGGHRKKMRQEKSNIKGKVQKIEEENVIKPKHVLKCNRRMNPKGYKKIVFFKMDLVLYSTLIIHSNLMKENFQKKIQRYVPRPG
jgi:hypothetical protein